MIVSKKKTFVTYFVLFFIAIMFLLPFVWMISASLDSKATLAITMPHTTLANYKYVFTDPAVLKSFLSGGVIALGSSIIVVAFSLMAAYPLSRFNMKWKKHFMFGLLFMVGLPIMALMVPVYQLFFYIKFTNSIMAVTVFMASTAFPLAIWMMKNFMDSIPVELEESAWIDGASMFTGLRKIVAPLMMPGIFTVFIYIFVGAWGNFFVPFILLNSPDKMPAAVTIYQFFSSYGMVDYGKLAAFSTMYTIPPIILYFLAQKYMSSGFSMGGAAKG
jgi:multiple sugar transport system permease protein